MGKSIRVTTKKKRGRPPTTGKGIQVGERWHADELATIDAWIVATSGVKTRAQAIRRLVELGLTVKSKARPPASDQQRAREMASQTIDRKIDPAAPEGERVQRKRRLIKGPSEFREARVDRPKAKEKR